jgi:hypothetical protein
MGIINDRIYFALVFLTIGAFLVLLNSFLILRAYLSNKWTLVTGIIEKSNVEDVTLSNESVHSYKLRISYSYSVEGKTYVSSRVFFGDRILSSFKAWFHMIALKYSPGSNVQVYYKPTNPKLSVLEPGIKYELFIALFSGVILVVLGCFIITKP